MQPTTIRHISKPSCSYATKILTDNSTTLKLIGKRLGTVELYQNFQGDVKIWNWTKH